MESPHANPVLAAAATESELHQQSRQALNATISLVWNMVRFPAGNQVIDQSKETWRHAMRRVLLLRGSFVITLIEGRVYFEDSVLHDASEMVEAFRHRLLERRIRKLVFSQGVSDADLAVLSEIFTCPGPRIIERGGPRVILRQHDVTHIGVIETQVATAEPGRKAKYWQGRIEEIGLDQGEVIALLAGSAQTSRIISRELRLLVEAMEDPRFLGELLMRLAAEETGKPDPRELLRIARRVHYLLVLNSGFDPERTPGRLARAFETIDPEFRLRVLDVKLQAEARRLGFWPDALFAFQPEEYAELIARDLERNRRWRTRFEGVRMPRAKARAIRRALETRLSVSTLRQFSAKHAAIRGQRFEQLVTELPDAAWTITPLPVQAASLDLAPQAERASSLTTDLTEGYTYALLYLYNATLDRRWAEELFERLLIIVEARLELGRAAATLSLVRAMFEPMSPGPQRESFIDKFRRALNEEQREQLLDFIAERLVAGDRDVTDSITALSDLFGESLHAAVLERVAGMRARRMNPVLRRFLAQQAEKLRAMLDAEAESRSPMQRIRAIELAAMFDDASVRRILGEGLVDRSRAVRLATIYALGHGARDREVEALQEIAFGGGGRSRSKAERFAAIRSLGRMGRTRHIGAMSRVLRTRRWFRRRDPLKLAAAQALRDIGTAAAFRQLRRDLPDSRRTYPELYLGAVIRLIVRTGVAIHRFFARIGAAFDQAITAAAWAFRRAVLGRVAGPRSPRSGSTAPRGVEPTPAAQAAHPRPGESASPPLAASEPAESRELEMSETR